MEETVTDTNDKAVEALRQIKSRIGDLQKLKDHAVGEGRKWTLDAVWNIAHNTLLEIDASPPLS
jgi:hypothetical protein